MPVASRFCLTQPGRAAEVARLSSYRTRTSRNVRPMLQRSSRASPMVQPIAGHHPALGCTPGCHGKHPPQPGQLTWYPVIQATRGWLSTLIEGARPSGDHQRSSGKRTEQARYLRAIDAGCRPTRCSSCAPRELVRRRETFGASRARASWTWLSVALRRTRHLVVSASHAQAQPGPRQSAAGTSENQRDSSTK